MTPKEQLDKLTAYLLAPKEEVDIQLDYNEMALILHDVKQSLNELEGLKKFKETFDNYELAKKRDFIAYENWLESEKELTELKRDVKRYFDLANEGEVTKEVIDEFSKIRDKLLKGVAK